jgi:hypothetical protein
MRSETDRAKIEAFMSALSTRVGTGWIYFTGGVTALLHQWRTMTVDIDLKAEPEPEGFFPALAELKDLLDLNIELASPDQFIPPLSGWQERSEFIARHGNVDFFHYDFYAQALAKIERGFPRDHHDVRAMLREHLIEPNRLRAYFDEIEPALVRYPALEAKVFRSSLEIFLNE